MPDGDSKEQYMKGHSPYYKKAMFAVCLPYAFLWNIVSF